MDAEIQAEPWDGCDCPMKVLHPVGNRLLLLETQQWEKGEMLKIDFKIRGGLYFRNQK